MRRDLFGGMLLVICEQHVVMYLISYDMNDVRLLELQHRKLIGIPSVFTFRMDIPLGVGCEKRKM